MNGYSYVSLSFSFEESCSLFPVSSLSSMLSHLKWQVLHIVNIDLRFLSLVSNLVRFVVPIGSPCIASHFQLIPLGSDIGSQVLRSSNSTCLSLNVLWQVLLQTDFPSLTVRSGTTDQDFTYVSSTFVILLVWTLLSALSRSPHISLELQQHAPVCVSPPSSLILWPFFRSFAPVVIFSAIIFLMSVVLPNIWYGLSFLLLSGLLWIRTLDSWSLWFYESPCLCFILPSAVELWSP